MNEKPLDREMKEIVLPKPAFKFAQIVLILMTHVDVVYEDCGDCFDGKLNVIGAVGQIKTVTCTKCHGSGKSNKVRSRTSHVEIDGMLQITSVRLELNETPRNDDWGFEGVMYTGHIVWKSDLEESKRSGNIFRETNLRAID